MKPSLRKKLSSTPASSQNTYTSALWLASIIAFDQLTKYVALSFLFFGRSIAVFESTPCSLFMTLVTNTGAAWGFCSFFPTLLLFIRLIVISVLGFLWARTTNTFRRAGIVLIIGGALSNIIDSFIYGAVIDFIHVRFGSYDYPVFNIADSCIFIGTIGLIIGYTRRRCTKP